MHESRLLQRIYGRSADLPGLYPGVLVGPGDDCAVVRMPSGDRLLITVDQVVRGCHFGNDTPIDLVARKAVAGAVCDIAAMGGTPCWGLATGALRAVCADGDALFDAMSAWARRFGCPLVGGDIAAGGGDELVLTVTVGGLPHGRRGPVLRSGARAGDEVW